jgi:The Golgi pH Regulator (GPHR) Family N-terminal
VNRRYSSSFNVTIGCVSCLLFIYLCAVNSCCSTAVHQPSCALCDRPVSDADIQNLDKRLMQTMDMIVMKKKR